MSLASLRARLEAAEPAPWRTNRLSPIQVVLETPIGITAEFIRSSSSDGWEANSDLIAHAPTDLRLAADVIEAARQVAYLTGTGKTELFDAHIALAGALIAFEAAP